MYYAGDPANIFELGLIDFIDPAPTWFAQAACRGNTTDFSLDKGQPATAAKAICARCPVVDECLDYAIVKRETRGIWGGLTPIERRRHRLG
jgi:WhiB family redox-sensing transcriptional regulator